MTPEDFFIVQKRHLRNKENWWEYMREVIASIYTSSQGVKGKFNGRQIIELEKDRKIVSWDVDDNWARKAIKNMN